MNLGQKEIKKLPTYGVAKIKFGFLLVGLVSAQVEKKIIGDIHHLLTICTSQLLLTHQIYHPASQDGLPWDRSLPISIATFLQPQILLVRTQTLELRSIKIYSAPPPSSFSTHHRARPRTCGWRALCQRPSRSCWMLDLTTCEDFIEEVASKSNS